MPRFCRLTAAIAPVVGSLLALPASGAPSPDNPFGLPDRPSPAVTPMPGSAVAGGPAMLLTQPPPQAPPGTRSGPLMGLLSQQPAVGDFLRDTGITVYGWAEASYTFNADQPRPIRDAIRGTPAYGRFNEGRLFDLEHNDFLVNQLDLTVERLVNLKSGRFEVGGRMDLLYGTDARFVHSNGMFDDVGNFTGPQYQFDIPQLYVDLGVPVGNGLRVRLGKFEFFKPLDPNASAFYSHTFAYAAAGSNAGFTGVSTLNGPALPFTVTGATAAYTFGDTLRVEAGVVNGWDQSLVDNNSTVTGLGRVAWDVSNRTKLTGTFICGPELNRDNTHFRTALDVAASHSVTNDLALLFDVVYGIQARSSRVPAEEAGLAAAGAPVGLHPADDAHWYGASGNVIYRINSYVSAAGRLEWFRDEQGFTTGIAQNLYEATVGLTITPFGLNKSGGELKVRPELRFDYSDRPFFNYFGRHQQFTAAVDAIYNF